MSDNKQMYIEIINYANKRYNAGIMQNCLVYNRLNDSDEAAFVNLNKKQVTALNKSINTFMRKNGSTLSNFEHTYSDTLETAIAVNLAQQELQANITVQ